MRAMMTLARSTNMVYLVPPHQSLPQAGKHREKGWDNNEKGLANNEAP